MVTTDLDAGWTQLNDPGFSLAPSTKHGGIVSLTAGQYAEVRAADAATAVRSDLGEVGSVAALPARADVVLAYDRGTASQPVTWDTSSVGTAPGRYPVTGVVRTIGANDNQWVGAGGSTAYNAPGRVLSSSTAVRVTATVVVAASTATLTASTRCVAGKVVVTGVVKNTGTAPLSVVIRSAWGTSPTLTAAPAATRRTPSPRAPPPSPRAPSPRRPAPPRCRPRTRPAPAADPPTPIEHRASHAGRVARSAYRDPPSW